MSWKESPMGSREDIDAWIELEKTEAGNVGADIVVNPKLYADLTKAILSFPRPVTIADFGGGTGSLALDLLAKDPNSKPALSNIRDDLLKAREKILSIITIDMYDSLLQRAQEQKEEYGKNAERIQTMKVDIGKETLPIADGKISLAVSRQFLMHLNRQELAFHLEEVHRVLDAEGSYTASILNPARDLARYSRKHPDSEPLQDEQQYEYAMEHAGLKFSQRSTYRPLEVYKDVARESGFSVEAEYLSASVPGYELTHPTYYDTELPMMVLLKMQK